MATKFDSSDRDLDEMLRKMYCDAILKLDGERNAYDRNSDAYRQSSTAIEHCQESLLYLRNKVDRAPFRCPNHSHYTET